MFKSQTVEVDSICLLYYNKAGDTMKKIWIIFIGVVTVLSTCFLAINILKYNEYKKDIKNKEKDIKNLEEKIKDNKEELDNQLEEYEKIKNEKLNEIEELEKWQERVKEIENLLWQYH